MSGILRLESLTKGDTLKQGDKTPLKYRLFDADGDNLNIAGKSAIVRLVYPDFLTIGYEKGGLTVAQDDTVTFTIDNIIPSRIYHIEIIVDDQFIFPSRADETKFTVDKSTLGTEADIIQIIGKDEIVRDVKARVENDLEPFLGEIEQAETTRQSTFESNENSRQTAFEQAETNREEAESTRQSQEEARETAEVQREANEATRELAEDERETTFASYGPTLDAKADKNYVDAELEKKANRKQEEWIYPTLLNGAVSHHRMKIRYIKDTLGFVTVEGVFTNSLAGIAFVLPPGYRPIDHHNGIDSVYATMRVEITGNIRLWSDSTLERTIYARFMAGG